MIFKEIDIDSKKVLDPYFDLVDYEACEYCFTTLFMWQHVYKTGYFLGEDFAVLVGEYEGNSFSILPLARKEKIPKVVDFVIDYFDNNDMNIYLRGITQEVVDVLREDYPSRLEYIEERDLFDYIYDAESLRTLKGRKNQKKRNHINYFLKEYDGRYEYKLLGKENFDECLTLMKEWESIKEERQSLEEGMDDELVGIKKVFDYYEILKDRVKIFGIYIDGKLEAFSIGELLNENMALIHIEKANADIRGLYPLINQQFLIHEFKDVDFVNREEDLGIEGLRKAKLSYHPCRFVEKYTVRGL